MSWWEYKDDSDDPEKMEERRQWRMEEERKLQLHREELDQALLAREEAEKEEEVKYARECALEEWKRLGKQLDSYPDLSPKVKVRNKPKGIMPELFRLKTLLVWGASF